MSETCWRCRGDLEEKSITYHTVYRGQLVVVEDVPAVVCEQCGEAGFTGDVTSLLQKAVWSHAQAPRTISVPLFRFDELE